MKSNRLALFVPFALAVLGIASCTGNNTANKTEAPVYLSQSITQGPADVDISVPADVTIANMTINSHAKATTTVLSQQDDAILTDWVVTPSRSDGGTVASPVWHNYYQVYVPAGGTASLQNYRIFPAEYFQQPPLSQLFNGPDKETGNCNIRQRLHIAIYGKTVAGQSISLEFDVNLNFYYLKPSCS